MFAYIGFTLPPSLNKPKALPASIAAPTYGIAVPNVVIKLVGAAAAATSGKTVAAPSPVLPIVASAATGAALLNIPDIASVAG